MAPQFFKDAHSVLNNKFVPRAFSLNLNAKDEKANDRDNLSKGSERLDDSLIAPQAVSTAPSTGSSSSRFFGAYPGGKAQKHVKDQFSDNILGDSSIDNIENFVKASNKNNFAGVSGITRERPSSTRTSTNSSDDLLITDVREINGDHTDETSPSIVSNLKPEANEIQQEEAPTFQAAETSADLVMEALVKSQKLCSQFKEKLAQAQSKLSFQEDEILNYKKITDSMKENVKNFREHLGTLELKSKELKDAKRAESSTFSQVKNELDGLHSDIDTFKSEANNFKEKIDQLKQIKVSNSYEIERKNKEIQLFQQRLDETSGLLSEQKIKSSELEKTLEQCRKDYDMKISTALKEHEKSQNLLKNELSDFKSLFESGVYSKLEEFKPLLDAQKSDIDTKIDSLQERLCNSLRITEESFSSQMKETSTVYETTSSNIDQLSQLLKPKLEKLTNDQAFVNTICTQILDGYKNLVNEIQGDHGKSSEINLVCKDILSHVDSLQESYHKTQSHLAESAKLVESKKEIELKYSTAIAKVEDITNERDSLQQKIDLLQSDLKSIESSKAESESEIAKLKSVINSKETSLKQSDQKVQKCKTTCDSKLRTQMEIHKLISEERDKLKAELESKNLRLNKLEQDFKKLETFNYEKENVIESIRDEDIKNKSQLKKLQDQILQLRNENAGLSEKIRSQSKPTRSVPQDHPAPNSQESTNDLELTASFGPSSKTPLVKKPAFEQKPEIQQKRKILMSKYSKRKKLLDDSDTNTLFDDFDFDSTENVATLPKRYTKRKKTIGA